MRETNGRQPQTAMSVFGELPENFDLLTATHEYPWLPTEVFIKCETLKYSSPKCHVGAERHKSSSLQFDYFGCGINVRKNLRRFPKYLVKPGRCWSIRKGFDRPAKIIELRKVPKRLFVMCQPGVMNNDIVVCPNDMMIDREMFQRKIPSSR